MFRPTAAVVPLDAPRAVCSDPAFLPLVDEAYARPGSKATEVLRARACVRCPISTDCLDHAMTHREEGPWAGTNARHRAKNGGPHKRGASRATQTTTTPDTTGAPES